MGAPAKFLFDLDLAPNAGAREKKITPADVAAQVADAETRGYRNGFAAAQAEAEADIQRRVAAACADIAQSLAMTAQSLSGVEMKLENEAVEVALATARKLASNLIAREPLEELKALIGECFRELVATPHLVVRVNDQLYEQAKHMVEDLARRSGFDGKLIILAEPDIATGDGRIEWADGGVTRDQAATDARVTELVNRYLAARNAGGQ